MHVFRSYTIHASRNSRLHHTVLFQAGFRRLCRSDPMLSVLFFQVQFRRLELVTTASVELDPASPTFLQEARPTRHVIITRVMVWVILTQVMGWVWGTQV